MMIHNDTNNQDDDHTTTQTKQEELKMKVDYLEQSLRKGKHHLYKRLKHLHKHGAIKV